MAGSTDGRILLLGVRSKRHRLTTWQSTPWCSVQSPALHSRQVLITKCMHSRLLQAARRPTEMGVPGGCWARSYWERRAAVTRSIEEVRRRVDFTHICSSHLSLIPAAKSGLCIHARPLTNQPTNKPHVRYVHAALKIVQRIERFLTLFSVFHMAVTKHSCSTNYSYDTAKFVRARDGLALVPKSLLWSTPPLPKSATTLSTLVQNQRWRGCLRRTI